MNVSTKQERIATLARQSKDFCFTSLNHYLDVELLQEAYQQVRKNSAPGYDGETVASYGENLEENLESLLNRAKSGRYVAPPVRRVYIPKGSDGKEKRPIGIPTVEDKILQRAVVMILEPIYEQNFLDCSFGFRKGRSMHQALIVLWEESMRNGTKWILDVDLRKFFDTLDHSQLQKLLKHRVRDGVITRLIGKWLNAGVLENEDITYPESGTPQGGVISPLLSNIYLHYVLDEWYMDTVKPRLKGNSFMVRFADDFVMGFQHKQDADQVLCVLGKRLGKYGLTINLKKTRLIPFGSPKTHEDGKDKGCFDFLGFTHYWGKTRKGEWMVKRKTAKDRYARSLKSIRNWCSMFLHMPIKEQHKQLSQKLHGHYGYYGITGNYRSVLNYHHEVERIWRKWLSRRTNINHMQWEKFERLRMLYPLPRARIVHSMYT